MKGVPFLNGFCLQVTWYKDTMKLDPGASPGRRAETYGSKHKLVISDVSETDFGNYSCLADNRMGRQRGVAVLSGE